MEMEYFLWINIILKIFLWIMWFLNIKGDYLKIVKNRLVNVLEFFSKLFKRLENF